jgi:hypothetical protein
VKKLAFTKRLIEKVMIVPILGMGMIVVVAGNFGIYRKSTDDLSN